MTTHLDDDLRAAFNELATTTTITRNANFGDVNSHPSEPGGSRKWLALTAAAACVTLVAGLAVFARDTTPEAPATSSAPTPASPVAADTSDDTLVAVGTVPPSPRYLFPAVPADGSPLPLFDSATDAVESYLSEVIASRTSRRPDAVIAATVADADIAPNAVEALVRFTLSVESDGGTDTADGVARVERPVDADGEPGSWFVQSAGTAALSIDTVHLAEGTVSGTFTPAIGGTYEVSVQEVTPMDDTRVTVAMGKDLDPIAAADGRPVTFAVDGYGQPAARVTIWHTAPGVRAVFGELVVTDGGYNDVDFAQLHARTSNSVDRDTTIGSTPVDAPAAGVYPPAGPSFHETPEEAAISYIADRVSVEALPDLADVGYGVSGEQWALNESDVWLPFTLSNASGNVEGVIRTRRLVDDPERWSVFDAGTAGFAFGNIERIDGVLSGSFTDDAGGVHELVIHDVASGEPIHHETISVDDGESATFRIDGLPDSAMTVRVWNLGEPGAPGLPRFGEIRVDGSASFVDFTRLLDDYVNQRQ